jgi:DNA-binding transcriptional MerR regulator
MATAAATTPGYQVAELAELVGVRPDTIRYYERAGLLPPPPRTSAGYRLYPAGTVDRVRFIRGCARLGLRLVDIADLLPVRDTGVCPCEPAEHLLQRRIADIDAELARLSTLRAELVQMTGALPGQTCVNPKPGTWLPDREGGEQPMSINNTCGCDEGCDEGCC